MVDTVDFKLMSGDVRGGVDFMEETPCYLHDVSEHSFANGDVALTTRLNGLKITITDRHVKVGDGSLCKWWLGDNYKVMGRGDIQRAVEALSDTLHLPMEKARVLRLDVAQNFITKHPVGVYLNHMGELRYTHRLLQPNGILWRGKNQCVCIYDKNKEHRAHHEAIPEPYRDRNVLRVEARCLQRLPKCFNVEAVTGGMLSDERFYIEIVKWWLTMYQAINKINDITLNFNDMKTKKQFQMMGVLSMVERLGGQGAMVAHIKEAQQRGELSAKQAHDLRHMVNDVCSTVSDCVVKSEAITELDKKMSEAVKYYR